MFQDINNMNIGLKSTIITGVAPSKTINIFCFFSNLESTLGSPMHYEPVI